MLSMLYAGGADGPYSRLVHKNPTLAEIRESLENNNYWISLMEGLQSDTALPKTKVRGLSPVRLLRAFPAVSCPIRVSSTHVIEQASCRNRSRTYTNDTNL